VGEAIEIARTDHTASERRAIAARCHDGAQVPRLFAPAMVLEGASRTEAAEKSGMERQTLRDWVHRYNAAGVDGLKSGHGPGHPPSLNADQMGELKEIVLKGPDPEKHGVVRWRCVDLRGEVIRRFGVDVTEGTIGKWLRKLDLTGHSIVVNEIRGDLCHMTEAHRRRPENLIAFSRLTDLLRDNPDQCWNNLSPRGLHYWAILVNISSEDVWQPPVATDLLVSVALPAAEPLTASNSFHERMPRQGSTERQLDKFTNRAHVSHNLTR